MRDASDWLISGCFTKSIEAMATGLKNPRTVYPLPKILYLPAIQEKVPAFEGTLRISRDVKVSSAAEFWGSLGKEGKTFTISAESSNTRPVTIRSVTPLSRRRSPL